MLGLPIIWKWATFLEVIVVIELSLIAHHRNKNLHYVIFQRPSNTTEPKGLFKYSFSNALYRSIFLIENVLVEECIVSILMGAVE